MLRKIKSSLNAKTFIAIAAMLILSGVLIFILVFIYVPNTYKSELDKRLEENFQTLMEALNEDSGESIEQYLQQFCISNKTSVYVTDNNGNIITSIDNSVYLVDMDQKNYSIKAEDTSIDILSGKMDKDAAFLSGVYKRNGESYTVSAYAKMEEINQVSDTLLHLSPYVLVFILVISLFGSFIVSRALTRPIIKISNISKSLSNMNLTWFCDVNRTDEIGFLADNLNEMAKKLDGALSDLKSANEELQYEMKQRSDLFMAISHELKTPVTVMRCDLEGMLYNIGRYKDRDKFLAHALKTTGLMESLIHEILTVAQLGSEIKKLEKSPADLSLLVSECSAMYQELAIQRNIDLRIECEQNVICSIDPNHMQKAISNIISNAVQHSPEGQTVKIHLFKSESTATLSVENSGVHIASDEIQRLFQPFYRMDKSRNRHSGGSGLGLYITKIILDKHRLHYLFTNTEHGVQFTIEFPLII